MTDQEILLTGRFVNNASADCGITSYWISSVFDENLQQVIEPKYYNSKLYINSQTGIFSLRGISSPILYKVTFQASTDHVASNITQPLMLLNITLPPPVIPNSPPFFATFLTPVHIEMQDHLPLSEDSKIMIQLPEILDSNFSDSLEFKFEKECNFMSVDYDKR